MKEMNTKSVNIQVELTDEQAWQLAEFCKRSSFGQYRECALTDDEAYTMIGAMGLVAMALREKGYDPR